MGGSRGSCLEIREGGGDLWVGQEPREQYKKLFLKDPETSEVVPGGIEAPVSNAGSVQIEAVQQGWYLGRAG